jgi:hypothetical protein
MTVMRWKWEDEKAEESKSNGMYIDIESICVLAKNVKEEGEQTNE